MIPLGILAAAGGAVAAVDSYDLLVTEILTSAQSSVTFAALGDYAADYQHLQLRMVLRNNREVGYNTGKAILQLNSNTSSSSYKEHYLIGNGSAVISGTYGAVPGVTVVEMPSGPGSPAQTFAAAVTDILDAFSSSKNTTVRTLGGVHTTGTALGESKVAELVSGVFLSTAAITTITMIADSASFVTGSRFSLYGLKAGA